jgi:hypothetical protein
LGESCLISRAHSNIEYWKECIDSYFGHVDLKTEVVIVPEYLQKLMV